MEHMARWENNHERTDLRVMVSYNNCRKNRNRLIVIFTIVQEASEQASLWSPCTTHGPSSSASPASIIGCRGLDSNLHNTAYTAICVQNGRRSSRSASCRF